MVQRLNIALPTADVVSMTLKNVHVLKTHVLNRKTNPYFHSRKP